MFYEYAFWRVKGKWRRLLVYHLQVIWCQKAENRSVLGLASSDWLPITVSAYRWLSARAHLQRTHACTLILRQQETIYADRDCTSLPTAPFPVGKRIHAPTPRKSWARYRYTVSTTTASSTSTALTTGSSGTCGSTRTRGWGCSEPIVPLRHSSYSAGSTCFLPRQAWRYVERGGGGGERTLLLGNLPGVDYRR